MRHEIGFAQLRPLLDVEGNERCGLLVARDGVIVDVWPVPSLRPSPVSYAIGRSAWIDGHRRARELGVRVVGSIHSHPDGPEGPSEQDLEIARHLPPREIRAVWHPRSGRLTFYGREGILASETVARPLWLRMVAPVFWI